MPYELTLQPKPLSSLSKEDLREKLLSFGLQADPDSVPPGLLSDGFALLQIEEDSNSPTGFSVTAKLPYCRPLEDVCRELVALSMLAFLVEADLRDGDAFIHIPIGGSSTEDITTILMSFCERYSRASDVAVRIFGRADG